MTLSMNTVMATAAAGSLPEPLSLPPIVGFGAQTTQTMTAINEVSPSASFTYIPMANDTLTYAFRIGGLVSANMSEATLKRIYQCDSSITFPSNPSGFRPLIPGFGDDGRTFLFQKLGITDLANYTTLNPCVRDTDEFGAPIVANDGRYLNHPRQLVTYLASAYLVQILNAGPDIHGNAALGSINGISPILDPEAFGSRPVFNVVRTADIDGVGVDNQTIRDLFVGPGSRVCSNTSTIRRAGFGTRADCGSTALVSGP